jgi:hypothetical protein
VFCFFSAASSSGDSGAATWIIPDHLPHYGDFRHRNTSRRKFLAPHTGIPINWYSDQLALGTPFEHIQISPFTKGFHI